MDKNRITNRPEHKNHPLFELLLECIHSNTGGSTSERFGRALGVKGWKHNFIGFFGNYSLEELVWDDDSVFQKLTEIYA